MVASRQFQTSAGFRSQMATHTAVVTVAPRARLELHHVPTPTPSSGEVLIRNEWTASTPLDLHQNDGHLLVTPPQILGDAIAGTVQSVGPDVKNLEKGDKVFGYAFQGNVQKAHQEFVCVPEHLIGKVPGDFTLQEAVTLPTNVVTVFHTLPTDLHLKLPWPKPEDFAPEEGKGKKPILVWGGSSSVGQFALQVLRWYGYTNLLAIASKRNHALLREYGATQVFDYNDSDVVEQISKAIGEDSGPLILDCIGSQDGSLAPIAKIAQPGAIVAILLPVIVRDASTTQAPEYSLDVAASAKWKQDVDVKGVRTHFWQDNPFLKEKLQTEIMPRLLRMGVVKPNRQRIVEGADLLERAEKAMALLRSKEVSGERLVWRVAE